MKRIITAIILIYTFLSVCLAQNVTSDTIVIVENETGTVEWVDVPDNNSSESGSGSSSKSYHGNFPFNSHFDGVGNWISSIAIVAIAFSFGLPAIVIFLVFYFQYKNRKAKYKLAEQALASGQPIPQEIMKEVDGSDKALQNKGIKNIFLGIGLFIFLWAIIDIQIGTIGLFIMFIGLGQLVIYRVNRDNSNK